MAFKYVSGPDLTLTEELIREIVATVPQLYILKHVAQYLRINYKTLFHWMKKGKDDIESGKDSIYAELVISYRQKKSEALKDKLEFLCSCPRNYGAITWLLERVYKEDFETKSETQKQIEDFIINFLKPMVEKGDFNHGGEKIEIEFSND